MKKLYVLGAFFLCSFQQSHAASLGNNAIMYALGAAISGTASYLSYEQAKKEEATKEIYLWLSGACAATSLITLLLACNAAFTTQSPIEVVIVHKHADDEDEEDTRRIEHRLERSTDGLFNFDGINEEEELEERNDRMRKQ